MPPSWSIGEISLVPPPQPRYAHLSCVSGDRLFIIGGQNLDNSWLNDVCIYDLRSRTWILKRDYPHDRGVYRSVAVSANSRVHLPQEVSRNTFPNHGCHAFVPGIPCPNPSDITRHSYSPSPFNIAFGRLPQRDLFVQQLRRKFFVVVVFLFEWLSYSGPYQFAAVKRELEVLTPLPNGDFRYRDASSSINGPDCPPGLRFPAGAILGTHLIITGIYLARGYQSFAVWALDLIDMSWSHIDPGSTLTTGSWFRSGLWAKANKFIVFGNQQGNLVEDYNQRLLSWDHITMIDLEAIGIHLGIPTLIISMG